MPKNVQIGSDIFEIPIEGESPPWGEEVTDCLVAIGDALTEVQNEADILPTSATLANNQPTPANIPGLVFNTGIVIAVEVDFFIKRIYDSGSTTVVERGKSLGYYDGSVFTIATETVGDSGVVISVTNGGQFQYTSDNKPNSIENTIVFRAKTILEP